MKKIALICLCFGLYGCGFKSDGLAKLKELCEKDAGVTIYKTVEADGYYDAYTDCHHCWQELLKSEYQFVEFCDEEDRNSLTYAIPESGCYRVLKEKRAGNSCHVDIDNKLNKKSVEPYVSFIKDHCIAVTKIEKPEAPAKFSIKEAPFDKTKDTFFMRFEFIIEDGNDVLSKQVDYTYYTSNERLPSYSCRHVIDGFKRYSIDEFTHKTINSNNFGDLK